MSLLLDPQIIAAIVTVGLTVVAGVIGFIVRERIAQAKPFISVLRIEGENLIGGKNVDIPLSVVESIRKVAILTELNVREPLQTVSQVLYEVERFRDRGQDLLDHLAVLRRALTNSERGSTEEVLSKIIRTETFNTWLTSLLGDGNIPLPEDDKQIAVLVPYNFEPEFKNGSFSIRLAGYSILFGRELNRFKMYRLNVERLLPLISKFEYAKLSVVFDQVEQHIRDCLIVSKDAAPILQDIINQNSQWSIRLFVANLGRTPFLVEPNATLEVSDTTGASYSEDCGLFLISQDKEGDESSERTDVPLIIRAQSDAVLGFITKKTQSGMERGGAFREVYKSGKAKCQIKFFAQQTGLSSTAKLQSPPVEFQRRV